MKTTPSVGRIVLVKLEGSGAALPAIVVNSREETIDAVVFGEFNIEPDHLMRSAQFVSHLELTDPNGNESGWFWPLRTP